MENDKKKIDFVQSFFIKEVKDAETGEIKADVLSLGIKWFEFQSWVEEKHKTPNGEENHITPNGYVNLHLCKSKTGKWYAKWNDSQWRASTGTIDHEVEEKIP